jgi:hypothetical protein
MRKTLRIQTAAAALGLALTLPPAERAVAAGAGPFDGAWSVEVDCPDVGDVRGYNWRFPAQVSSGVLTGHYQSPTNTAMGDFRGRIRPDGEALITVVARTGPEEVAIGHERPGTPFRYTANVRFDAHSGFGKRNERRACTLTFTKT